MSRTNPSRTVAAELTRGLSRDDLEALRVKAGLEVLPEGTLQDALLEHGYSVEDLVTLLMAALVEKNAEMRDLSTQNRRLKTLCKDQMTAIDQISDQTARLKSALAALAPDQEKGGAMARLKALAERPSQRPD